MYGLLRKYPVLYYIGVVRNIVKHIWYGIVPSRKARGTIPYCDGTGTEFEHFATIAVTIGVCNKRDVLDNGMVLSICGLPCTTGHIEFIL